MKNILLCSGGLDSMLIRENYKDDIDCYVYIKYRGDHPATLQELRLLEEEGIEPIIVNMDDIPCDDRGFYSGRNLHFMIKVRELFPDDDITVFVGSTANDNFSDNNRGFFYKLEDVINNSYPRVMRIICPLENRTKGSLIKEAKEKNVNFYFCDTGDREPCMNCHSCQTMIEAGFFD